MTFDEIKIDVLKHALEPVQQAHAAYQQASALREQSAGAAVDRLPFMTAEKEAHAAYVDACMTLHGYIRATVNRAEGRAPDLDA